VDLADRAKERTEHFSGGMRRRLNIAVGLLHRPRLLILDEPTVGVDPQSRNAILASVEALSADGMGILSTTHYMEEAERLCTRVGIIAEGRIIAEGTRRELVALVGGLDRVSLAATGDIKAAAAEVRPLDRRGHVQLSYQQDHDGDPQHSDRPRPQGVADCQPDRHHDWFAAVAATLSSPISGPGAGARRGRRAGPRGRRAARRRQSGRRGQAHRSRR
jgi:ABC-type multidrug transport system ATPase subunit